jgi:hypothetical protein
MIRFQGWISELKLKDSFMNMNMEPPKRELLPKMQTISSRHFKQENMVKMAIAVLTDGYRMSENASRLRVLKNSSKR